MHNLLTTSTDLLRVITGSAADLDCIVSFIEYTTAGPPVLDAMDTQFTNVPTATTATILGAPSSGSDRRRIKAVSIVNTHASVSTTVRVIIERTGPVNWDVFNTVTLKPGESLTFTEGTGWFHNKQTPSVVASGSASLAAQGPGFASDTYIVGSSFPVTGRLQAGSLFRWRVVATKTAAGTATPIWNIRFGTAGTTADTSRGTHTGLAQTAASDTATFMVEANFRAVGASAVIQSNYGLAFHRLAATGFCNQAIDCTQALSGTFDSSIVNSVIGLSVNGGLSAAWTIVSCTLDAVNMLPNEPLT